MRFGIEEEYFVVEPGTGRPARLTDVQRRHLLGLSAGGSLTHPEWLRFQFECATPVCASADEALRALRDYRSRFAEEVAGMGLTAVSMGAVPDFGPGDHAVSPDARYQRLAEHVPGVAAGQFLCGQHVHIEIPTDAGRIHVFDFLRRWLPMIVALAANSRLWQGRDSGFDSWRMIQYRTWVIQGMPPHFADAADYASRTAALVATPGVFDPGQIGWAVRVSTKYPTVEVRCVDAQSTAKEAVFVALMIRALAMRTLRSPAVPDDMHPEIADLAMWHAAKYGLGGDLLRLPSGAVESGWILLAELCDLVADELDDEGEVAMVEQHRRELSTRGNGAQRQRTAFASGGVSAVVAQAAAEFTAG